MLTRENVLKNLEIRIQKKVKSTSELTKRKILKNGKLIID